LIAASITLIAIPITLKESYPWVLPNTACTRLVGVGAFSGRLRGWSWFRQSSVISSRPPAGNASRWAAIKLSQ
jgi:hypothetical protein